MIKLIFYNEFAIWLYSIVYRYAATVLYSDLSLINYKDNIWIASYLNRHLAFCYNKLYATIIYVYTDNIATEDITPISF